MTELNKFSDLVATHNALKAVGAERRRQRSIYGTQELSPAEWLVVLVEEIGEVASEIKGALGDPQELDSAALRAELVQVAAVAVQWIEQLDAPKEPSKLEERGA